MTQAYDLGHLAEIFIQFFAVVIQPILFHRCQNQITSNFYTAHVDTDSSRNLNTFEAWQELWRRNSRSKLNTERGYVQWQAKMYMYIHVTVTLYVYVYVYRERNTNCGKRPDPDSLSWSDWFFCPDAWMELAIPSRQKSAFRPPPWRPGGKGVGAELGWGYMRLKIPKRLYKGPTD